MRALLIRLFVQKALAFCVRAVIGQEPLKAALEQLRMRLLLFDGEADRRAQYLMGQGLRPCFKTVPAGQPSQHGVGYARIQALRVVERVAEAAEIALRKRDVQNGLIEKRLYSV